LQKTIRKSFEVSGISLHRGEPVFVRVRPAEENSGITFLRKDVVGKDPVVKALYNFVSETNLCTRISNKEGVSVQTIEHLMAALAGTGIHNAMVEIDGPELPILDGSARGFVKKILEAGERTLGAPIRGYSVTKNVVVRNDKAWARLSPADDFSIDFKIDYSDTVIGKQTLALLMRNGTFVRELCDSRTFCRDSEISLLKGKGLAKGGTLGNAVVIGAKKVENAEGFRRADECVRHKMLDAMGDLSLAGAPIIAAYSSNCGGHTLTNELLRQAFLEPSVFLLKDIDPTKASQLPGFGLKKSDLRNLA